MKPVSFQGNSLDVLRAFPQTARRMAGLQLDRVQRGLDPDDWKPMASVGAGVREIRIRDVTGAFSSFVCHAVRAGRVCAALFSEEKCEEQPSGYRNRPAALP